MSQACGCVTAICCAVKPSLTSYCRVIPRSCSACALIGSSRLTPVPTTRRVVPCRNAGAGNAERFAPTTGLAPTAVMPAWVPSAAAARDAEPLSRVRRVTEGCSDFTLTGCEDLSDEVFLFNAVPPVESVSPARLHCRVLHQLPRNTPLSRARTGASRVDNSSVPTSYRRCEILEYFERRLHLSQIEITRDEDDPAAMILVRPLPQMPRHVDDVLHTFHQQRTSSRADVEQTFQPEDPVAVPMEQHGQPDAEHLPVERAIEDETPGRNSIAHGMDRCWSHRVAIDRERTSAEPIEPFAELRFPRQQRGEIDAAEAGIDDGRGGIDRSQLRRQILGHLWRGQVPLGHDHVVGGCHLP